MQNALAPRSREQVMMLDSSVILTMSTAIHHAMSSAKKYGGKPEDYLHIHEWFDQTKRDNWHFTHRMILHHTLGIEICEQVFGPYITVVTGTRKDGTERTKNVPIRWIGEQHMREDFGFVPTPRDWMQTICPDDGEKPGARPWMLLNAKSAEQLGVQH